MGRSSELALVTQQLQLKYLKEKGAKKWFYSAYVHSSCVRLAVLVGSSVLSSLAAAKERKTGSERACVDT